MKIYLVFISKGILRCMFKVICGGQFQVDVILIFLDFDDVVKNWYRVLLWRDGEKSESVLGEILI